MYYFKPKVNIIFIKLTVVFCCLLYCRSKANGGERRGGGGGRDRWGGSNGLWLFCLGQHRKNHSIDMFWEKGVGEGGGGLNKRQNHTFREGGRVEKSALVNRQLTANLVIGKRQIYTSGAHRGWTSCWFLRCRGCSCCVAPPLKQKTVGFYECFAKTFKVFLRWKIMERFTFQISDAQPKKHVFCDRFFLDR
jgi:hypothetical protein